MIFVGTYTVLAMIYFHKNSQMAYTNYVKLRILHHHFQGLKQYTIAKELQKEGIRVSRFGVHIMYACMTCYWLFLFSVNMLKGRVILGTGHTVSQRKVHGYELQNNEIAVMVESLKVSSFKHSETGSTTGRLSIITSRVKPMVEEQMQQDDETTAYQLHRMLVEKGVQTLLRTLSDDTWMDVQRKRIL